MANQLYDKGCSDEFQRLDVDLNGNIVCSTVYDIGQVGGNGIPQIEFSSAENVSLTCKITFSGSSKYLHYVYDFDGSVVT